MEPNVFDKVHDVDLKKTMEQSYIDYAMSVISARALPDARDGLKPVQRRVLFSMIELNNGPDKPHRKCARIVGDTMGKYHPHGETNIYKTCVKLARPWKNAVEFIDGSGSYGNEMGKGASAFRYLEAKLSLFSLYCYFKDFDEAIVPMKDGYIDEITEPEYLPARYPAVLTKSCKAIGYGMYSELIITLLKYVNLF